MHFAVIGFFVLVAFYLWTLMGCTQSQTQQPVNPVAGGPAIVKNKPLSSGAKANIRKKLRALAAKPAPTKLSTGAMCYEMAMLPSKATYVCPTCGERSLYSTPEEKFVRAVHTINTDLPQMRRLIKTISGLDAKLDESEFCSKCEPKVDKPEVVLVVTFGKGSKPHRVRSVNSNDIKLLAEFMAGKDKHVGATGNETPLKKHLKRISELLGVKLDD